MSLFFVFSVVILAFCAICLVFCYSSHGTDYFFGKILYKNSQLQQQDNSTMGKTIYILRHAKARRDYARYQDYERPLGKKGIRDAGKLGEWMKASGNIPGVVIASNALRGRHTASIVAEITGVSADNISYEQSLYGATVNRWLQKLRRLDGQKVNSVMVVGHNPEIEQLVAKLSGVKRVLVPPCGMVAISSNSSWKMLGTEAKTSLLWSHYPKRYSELRPETAIITAEAAREAIKCLPPTLRDAEARHSLSESIFAAISKIIGRKEAGSVVPGKSRGKGSSS